MRFTNGMKKALSIVLSAAMVVTGASIIPSAAKAADGDPITTPFTVKIAGSGWNGEWNGGASVKGTDEGITVDKLGTYDIVGESEMDVEDLFAKDAEFCLVLQTNIDKDNTEYGTDYVINPVKITVNDTEYTWDDAGFNDEGGLRIGIRNKWNEKQCALNNSDVVPVATGDKVTFTFEVVNPNEDDDLAAELAKEEEIAEENEQKKNTYVEGTMDSFKLMGLYSDKDWLVSDWGTPENAIEVSQDGTYTIKLNSASGDFTDLNSLWIETNLYKATTLNKNFAITVDKVTVGSTDYIPATNKKEITVEGKADTKVGEGSKVIVYNAQNARYTGTYSGKITYTCDNHNEEHTFEPGSYRVNLINMYNTAFANPTDATSISGAGDDAADADGVKHWVDAFANNPISGKTGDAVSITVTIKGMNKGAANTTPTTTTKKNPIKKVTAAKKTVSVKKGKTVSVKFNLTAATKSKKTTDTVKATIKNKKIAKISGKVSTTAKKSVVKVKGVKKGSTTLTLKVGKKSAKVTIKVK